MSSDSPYNEVLAKHQNNHVDVLYATDRRVDPEAKVFAYGSDRSASLAVGICRVSIGENVAWETLERESLTAKRSTSLPLEVVSIDERFRFPATGKAPERNDRSSNKKPVTEMTFAQARDSIHSLIHDRLKECRKKEAYVFIHGYNNSFDAATFRMASLWHYLGRDGVPIVYSWPAGSNAGVIRGYTRDRESGEFTILHLKQFLSTVAECDELEKVHIIAHSRGTDVLMTAIREMKLQANNDPKQLRQELKIGNLILAAPDMDWEVTQQRVTGESLALVPERFTIYISREDKAIAISEWLFDSARRIGRLLTTDLSAEQQATIADGTGIDLINVAANTSFLGHSYFIDNPAVLSDLILLLRDNRPAGKEFGRPLEVDDGGVWQINDGYPKIR